MVGEGAGEGVREGVGRGETKVIGSGEANAVPRGEESGELACVGSGSDSDRQPTRPIKITNKPANHPFEINALKDRSVRLILYSPYFKMPAV